MYRILLLVIALGTTTVATQAQGALAQEARVRVGEIALQGTIETLDVVKNTLTLRATSFGSATGATKKLPLPKLKVIHIGDAARFLESSGLKNQSLGDLAVGLAVRVVGKEMGAGKPFAARTVTWSTPKPVLPPDPDTPSGTAALLPAPVRSGDFSLRVIDAGFAPLRALLPYPYIETRPAFFFAYRLSGPEMSGTNDSGGNRTLNDLVLLKRLYGSQGQILSRPDTGPLPLKIFDGETTGKGQRVFVKDLDPSWPTVTAEWEILDPQAPPSARGIVTSTLTFDHLPVPGAVGKSLLVNRTLTTALGTQFTLEKVTGEQVSTLQATNSYLHWVAPPNVPDLTVSLSINKITSGDSTWQSSSGGGSSQGNDVSYRIDTLGPDGAREMAITYKIREQAPSLQERKWFSALKLNIPVAALLDKTLPPTVPAPEKAAQMVLAEAATPDLRAQVEFRDRSWSKGFGGWLWIKSTGLADDQRWLVREVTGNDEQGRKLNSWMFPLTDSNLFWRADGTRSTPNEYAQPFVAVGETKPTAVNLHLKLEKATRYEHWSHFQNVPIPTPGQTLELKAGQVEDDIVSVRRLVSFKNVAELPGFNAERYKPRIKAGVAVVVEVSPLMPGADIELLARSAADQSGRELSDNSYAVYNGDRTRSALENTRFRTIILPLLSSDATSLKLRFETIETNWSGQIRQVELKNIPVK